MTDDRVATVLLHAVLAVLVLSAVLYTGVFEAALFSSDAPRNADYASELGPNEAVEAGLEVRQHGVEDMSELAFVGDWSAQYEEDDPWRGNHWQTITRVLIYGGVNAKGIWDVHELSPESDGGPTFTTDANTTDCTVKVRKVSESELEVNSCGPN